MEETKKRSTWLTIWLSLMLITNTFSILIYFTSSKAILATYSNMPAWIWYVFGLVSLANLIFVIFLFRWKKWPFYALCGTALVAFIMNMAIGLGIFTLFGLLGPLILYFSMKPQWKLFE